MQRLGLVGGALSAIGAMQSAGECASRFPVPWSPGRFAKLRGEDLTGDFRVGFLLGTSPRKQWFAQCIGTMFASVIAPAIYVLFTGAYGCINDTSQLRCPFQVPTASAWRAIATATTNPASGMPRSSLVFAVIMAIIGSSSVLIRRFLWTGKWHWVRRYHPNFMLVSLGFIIPATIYATAMLLGAIVAWYWNRHYPASFSLYGYAVIAGCTMGEGIGGVLNAALHIIGLSGDKYGINIGCPGGVC